MSLKALSIQHLQSNEQRNQCATLSCVGEQPGATASFWSAFYLEASRLYQIYKPDPGAWQEHQKHLKNADTLLFLDLPHKAATEFKLALEAIQTAGLPAKGA